ncbi:MAG: AMP-binding protein [Gammaproteobacteria bacterium]|nr:AMP-binding protein [Gammaproteobacteria bacterium]
MRRVQAVPEWYPKRRFGDLPDDMARRFPNREALVFKDERYTFAEVRDEIDRAAKALMALGVHSGDHVSLWLNNRPAWLFLMFALAKIGAVQVPINTRFRTNDLEYVVRQSDSAMLITHDVSGPVDYLDMVREVVALPDGDVVGDANFPKLKRVVIVGDGEYPGTTSWDSALARADSVSDAALRARAGQVDPDEPVFIMYTSGTTGFPKGVVHDHRLIRNVEERAFRMAVTERDTIMSYLPLFHAFGYSEAALMSMVSGARQILTETFDPDEVLDLVESEQGTIAHGFEAHMQGLCDAQEAKPRDLSSLRTGLFAAGMHSATPGAYRGERVLKPLKALSAFGMTEVWVGACLSALDDDPPHRLESSGYPAPGYEVKVVDPETGEDLPAGIPGEIRVRGYALMQGYYKKPRETAESYDADGWFCTGDMGERQADGYFRFLGRFKDMLKVGGENVDPMEAEGLLLTHPAIQQVAVVGLPDVRLGEVAVAFVERRADADVEEADVIAFCRGKVASFKLPRHVVFIDEFPMTASGKIRKVELREEAKRLLKPPGQAG